MEQLCRVRARGQPAKDGLEVVHVVIGHGCDIDGPELPLEASGREQVCSSGTPQGADRGERRSDREEAGNGYRSCELS